MVPGKTVAIIGAGVSGLTCIKSCLEEGLRPVCFEASKEIGGVWVYRDNENQTGRGRLYRSTVTNTSKEMMSFSDFPPPPHLPPFLRHDQLRRYYESYADFFHLTPHVKTESEVVAVEKAPDHVISGRWVVTVRSTANDNHNCDANDDYYYEDLSQDCAELPILRRLLFDAVIVCVGILGKKNLPVEEYEGYFQFQGMVLHACTYRRPDDYVDKKVVIVGGANTAGDLAVEIGNVAKQVYLSTRHGCWVVGRTALDSVPWDLSSYSRFLHLWIPAWIRAKFAEKFIKLRINHEKLGLQCDKDFLRGQKMINDSLGDSILSGRVIAKPGIRSFAADDVVFGDFTRAKNVNAVIFATGYQHHFPFLIAPKTPSCGSFSQESGSSYGVHQEDDEDPYGAKKLDLYGHVFPPRERHDTLAFVGCMEPTGPVAPAIELQSRWVARVFSRRASLPVSVTARLREMRQRRARDVASMGYGYLLRPHDAGGWEVTPSDDLGIEALGRKIFPLMEYQEDLAARIGCLPSLWRLFFSDFSLFRRLLFGPCHPASYRLQGPASWRGARDAIFNAQINTDAATSTRHAVATPTPTASSPGWGWWWWNTDSGWGWWFLCAMVLTAVIVLTIAASTLSRYWASVRKCC